MYNFKILLKFWAYIVFCKRTEKMILSTKKTESIAVRVFKQRLHGCPTKAAQKKLDWQQMWQVHLQHGIMVECCPLHRSCQPSWSWLAKSSSWPYPSRMHLVLEVWWSKGSKCLNASKRLKNGKIWKLSGYCGLELLLLAFFAYELWQRLKSFDEGFDAFMKTGWNCGWAAFPFAVCTL